MGTEATKHPTMSAAARKTLARLDRLEKARRSADADGEQRDRTAHTRSWRPFEAPSQSGTTDPAAHWHGMGLGAPFAAQVIGQALGAGRSTACDALSAGIAYCGGRARAQWPRLVDERC